MFSANVPMADYLQALAMLVGLGLLLWGVQWYLNRRYAEVPGSQLQRQLIWLACVSVLFIGLLIALPISPTLRGQLLSLIGIVVSATIALSSTTFVGNAMAGVMLRAVGNFNIGDFIDVNGHFGRVAERGLLHIEIQTEDRDLTTLPNLILVQNPVKVIHAEGTIVSATVSLGYDVPHDRVECLLLEAAEAVGLADPFVQITDLGDYSVVYRVAGMLTEVRKIITKRSALRAAIMDSLHSDGIEVMSPRQMVTRSVDAGFKAIPQKVLPRISGKAPGVEDVAFDKVERAEVVEKLRQRWEAATQDLERLKAVAAADITDPDAHEKRIATLEGRVLRLRQRVDISADAVEGVAPQEQQ